MFSGQFRYTLDPKGRLTIPSRYREHLTNGSQEVLVVTAKLSQDAYLVAYPLGEWEQFLQRLRGFPSNNKSLEDWKRFFVSRAQECPLDRSGRILVPPSLREFAYLSRDVTLLGMTEKFEIWDSDRYKEKEEEIRKLADPINADVSRLGL